MKKVETFGRYLRRKYRRDIKKIPISISGFTCPNIDGTVARGGCTFCQNESFSPNFTTDIKIENRLHPAHKYVDREQHYFDELYEQYAKTSKLFRERYGISQFIIYFQSFTNTYAPTDFLIRLYQRALALDGVMGISIGTRTDCVDVEILEFLSSIEGKEVWIEYGIQTMHDATLQKINRGHDVQNMVDVMKQTKEYGVKICAHLIFGLPGESREMMKKSVDIVYDLGVDSLKIHPLYVVNRTALAISYQNGTFAPIEFMEYIEMLLYTIKKAPSNVIFQRVSAGVDDETLIAPHWCRDKNYQMSIIRNRLKESGFLY